MMFLSLVCGWVQFIEAAARLSNGKGSNKMMCLSLVCGGVVGSNALGVHCKACPDHQDDCFIVGLRWLRKFTPSG